MRRSSLVLALLVAFACGRAASDRSSTADTASTISTRPPAASAASLPWPEMLGSFVAVAHATTEDALLFRRDTASTPDRIAVVGYDSTPTPVVMRDVRSLPCATRALLRLTSAPNGWSLALDSARAQPVLIDALEDLSHADSQRVVVRIQRALNTLPDSADAEEYHSLPVVVRDAWVVHFPSAPVVVARAARLRNVEAAAHEELRFVVLSGDQPVFVARVAGEEDTVESWDLLAALNTVRGPMLAVAREGTRSLQLELVMLEGGAWKSVWRSDGLSCAAPR